MSEPWPVQWDDLTEDQAQAALEAVLAELPGWLETSARMIGPVSVLRELTGTRWQAGVWRHVFRVTGVRR